MKELITVKSEYNSLDKILNYLKNESSYECTKVYDSWEVRTDSNGQMEQCILVKKSSMHGLKAYYGKDNTLNISYIIPNKFMHAYFGKSKKARRNIIEIITGEIKSLLLVSSQKKSFEEIKKVFDKAVI